MAEGEPAIEPQNPYHLPQPTREMIELWISESDRMWIDARRSIQQAKQIQQKIIEQRRTLGCTDRIAPWVEP